MERSLHRMTRRRLSSRQGALAAVGLALMSVLTLGCNASGPGAGSGAGASEGLRVVAGENFWGSIASRLGGSRVVVQSIVVNPSTDPHSYEPTAQDARTIAGARMAIVNGIGYDSWMPRELAATPSGGRVVLTVGNVLGLREGDNPHQWYSPRSVYAVIDQIVADYERLDPSGTAYFARQKQSFESRDLARYNQLRRQIRARYGGVAVGYSESIFRPLGEDLGLELLTPYSFARAIAQGTDVTAQDKLTVDRQAQSGEIKVWIYNSQNVTPDVQRVTSLARARRIPIARVTETLAPATDSFEQWQVSELEGLMAALHRATGR